MLSGLVVLPVQQGEDKGRPIYNVIYGMERNVAITVGSNGYVVGANLASAP
jgi:hypothetical protein